MLRLSRMADFAIVVMTELAQSGEAVKTASELAMATQLPAPAVAKILARLAREGLLTSVRGVKGGYALSRSASNISIGSIVTALEGPVALTQCVKKTGQCDVEPSCRSRLGLHRINVAVRKALDDVSLADIALPRGTALARPSPPPVSATKV